MKILLVSKGFAPDTGGIETYTETATKMFASHITSSVRLSIMGMVEPA